MLSKRERHVVSRVYNALSSIPFPASGRQSTTVLGLSQFAAEMRKVLPAVNSVLTTLCGESYFGELDDDMRVLESVMTQLEKSR